MVPEPAVPPGNLSDRKILKFFLASFQTYQIRHSRIGGHWHPHAVLYFDKCSRDELYFSASRKKETDKDHTGWGVRQTGGSWISLAPSSYMIYVLCVLFLLHLFMYLFSVCGMSVYTWQFTWISSILLPWGFHGLNSGPQAWQPCRTF